MLEETLGEHTGMKVRLEGEFDLMLLPDIGVSGTGLVIGGPDPESEFARSEEYEMSVALKPLLEGRVRVEWIRLTGGRIYPERYPQARAAVSQTAESASAAILSLPEIGELAIRDFQIDSPGQEDSRLNVKEFTINGFAGDREAPFVLEIENLVTADGKLRWDSSQSSFHLKDLKLDLGRQSVGGEACLYLQPPGSLRLDLRADVFDLDAFNGKMPGFGGGGGGGRLADLPLEIRARLRVDELRTGGAIARGVELSLGSEPGCD